MSRRESGANPDQPARLAAGVTVKIQVDNARMTGSVGATISRNWVKLQPNTFVVLQPNSHNEAGAGDETRTRDSDLGKVVLYQLSYSRSASRILASLFRSSWHIGQMTPINSAIRDAVTLTRAASKTSTGWVS